MKAHILVGPTATGKSAVAQWIAETHGAAIISADSMLVYRGMDIGVAKPSLSERGDVRYFGLDCVDAGNPFSVGDWLATLRRELRGNFSAAELIAVGGTGLYVKALLCGLSTAPSDPSVREHWTEIYERDGIEALRTELARLGATGLVAPGDFDNPRRLIRGIERAKSGETHGACPEDRKADFSRSPVVGLWMERRLLVTRIARRVDAMFDAGLIEEARRVRESAHGLSHTACQAIGYAEARDIDLGILSKETAKERIITRTCALAKKQLTWFRHQLNVRWVEIADGESVEEVSRKVIALWRKCGSVEILR